MKRTCIAFTGVRQVALVEEPLRALGDQELLIQNEVSAISAGTERANLLDLPNLADGPAGQFPKYLGYSGVGIVVDKGRAVKNFKPGDRVLSHWGSRHTNLNIVDAEHALRLDHSELPSEHAVFAIIASFSLNAIRKTRFEIGESAAVVGVGILGAFALALLRAAGATPLLACDLNAKRRALASQLGAAKTFDPSETNYEEHLRDASRGGANVVIEVTGSALALKQALGFSAPLGRVALLGCTRVSDVSLDYYQLIHRPGIEILGAHTDARATLESRPHSWTWKDDVRAILALMADGRIPVEKIFTTLFSPHDATEIYTRLADDPDFPVGAVFDWRNFPTGRM